MSYILNALRKSERERQVVQPDTLAERIDIRPEQSSRWRFVWLGMGLVGLNLLIWAYYEFAEREKSRPIEDIVAIPQTILQIPKQDQGEARVKATIAKQPEPNKAEPMLKKVVTKVASPSKIPSKTERGKATNKRLLNETPAVAPENDSFTNEEAVNDLVETKIKSQNVIEPTDIGKDKKEIVFERLGERQAAASSTSQAQPYLEDLPIEFQRQVPKLVINVLSYSTVEAERFVMIDMVKYVPGQWIKDTLLLQQIAADGIVVDYQGRVFKVRR